MSASLEERLRLLEIHLSLSPKPGANFAPTRKFGNLLYVSGQVPVADGVDQFVGKLGKDVSIEDGQTAAPCV